MFEDNRIRITPSIVYQSFSLEESLATYIFATKLIFTKKMYLNKAFMCMKFGDNSIKMPTSSKVLQRFFFEKKSSEQFKNIP